MLVLVIVRFPTGCGGSMKMESVSLTTVVLSDRVPVTLQKTGPPKDTGVEDTAEVESGAINTFFHNVPLTVSNVDEVLSDAAIV